MPATFPDLYTLDELLERYPHLSRDTMYDYLRSRALRGFKIGRVWHVTPEDWADFIAARRDDAIDPEDLDGAGDAPPAPSSRRRKRAS